MSDRGRTAVPALERALLSRRTLLTGALGLSAGALLAACGGDDDDDVAVDPSATTNDGNTESTATTGPEGGSENPTPTEEGGQKEASGTREFEHALGTSQIPANPQRVAVLNIIALDAALQTGVTPIAAPLSRETPWRSDVDAIEVKLDREVDIEQLAQIEPDLILHGAFEGELFGGMDVAILEEIAPVVAYDFSNDLEWPEYFRFFADALNRIDEAQDVIDRYNEQVEELSAQLEENPPRIALLRVLIDSVRNYTETGFAARIFDDLGIPTWDVEGWEFSLERIREIEADVVYLYGSEDDPQAIEAEMEEFTSSPVWQSHPAVEAGNAFAMQSYWFGFGYTEAMLVLEDLQETLPRGDTAEFVAFPVTIEHKFGSTTIDSAPERVVSVGLVDQDAMLALGTVPVATREWYGEKPGAIFPWAEDELGDADVPQRMDNELDFELIASLRPDVIVGLYSGLTQEEYDILSEIAPTVAQPVEYVDWGIPWQELTVKVGQILGKRQEAEALVAEVENSFATAREEHPEFAGATGIVASPYGLPENYYVYASQDVRGRLLELLGFDVPEIFDELAGEEFGATVSIEQLDLLGDLDVLIWVSDAGYFEDVALYDSLPVVQEGRVLYYSEDNAVYDALNFGTVLSLPFALENLVPALVAAIDGDPGTEPAE